MKGSTVTRYNLLFVIFICFSITLPPLVWGGLSSGQRCQARIYKIIGSYISCISRAGAAFARNGDSERFNMKLAGCEQRYEQRYERALEVWADACPSLENSEEDVQDRLETSVDEFMDEVFALVSGTPPIAEPGKAILFNHCPLPIKLMSPTNPGIDGKVLDPSSKEVLDLREDFNGNQANAILVAPVTKAEQCTAVNCPAWTDILYAPRRRIAVQIRSSERPPCMREPT